MLIDITMAMSLRYDLQDIEMAVSGVHTRNSAADKFTLDLKKQKVMSIFYSSKLR